MAQTFVPQSSPPNRPWGIYIAAGLAVLTVLGLTNPDQKACSHYAAEKLKHKICEQKSVAGVFCPVIIPLPNAVTASGTSLHTYRKNYLLLSVYHTKFIDTEVQTVGIAGQCF